MTDTRSAPLLRPAVVAFILFALPPVSLAQQPNGWISNGHTSAYTLAPGEFELTGSMLRVDDTIDFLNMREDLLSGTSRLVDNSGDLEGFRGELSVGVWRGLELFYSQQEQDLTLKVGNTAQAEIEDLSQKLTTISKRWGGRFVFYENRSNNGTSRVSSASLELSRLDNRSKDFEGYIKSVSFGPNTAVSFDPAQRFAMDNLKDDGWQAKLIYSRPLGNTSAVSLWAGYGEADATSGTSTDISFSVIQDAFLQTFEVSETQYMAGFSLNFQPIERLPIQVGYEYTHISDRQTQINSSNSSIVPSFLRGSNLANSASDNHTAYGNVSWWLSPQLYTSLSGKLFRNQFVGIMPHFNNPLSARFSETVYGYVELRLGLKLSR